MAAYLSSPSGTLNIVQPASEGAGFTSDINPNAFVGGTDISVGYAAGVFTISGTGGATATLPNTVIVSPSSSNNIGNTPQATSIIGAIALLPASIPATSPWTILFLAGTYNDVTAAQIPANVNLVALEPNSVTIGQTLTLGYSVSAITSTICTVSNLTFSSPGPVTWSPNVSAGGTSSLTIQNCTITTGVVVTLPVNTAGSAGGLPYANAVYGIDSTFTGTFAQNGGIADLKSCRVRTTTWTNGPTTFGLLQVEASTFAPTSFTNDTAFSSFRACTLGGAWINNNSTAQLHVDNCQTVAGSASGVGATAWTLTSNNSSKAYIKNTLLYVSCVVTGTATTYNLTTPSLLTSTTPSTPGFVDRDCAFTVKQVVSAPGGRTITVKFVNNVPYVTEHTSTTPTADTTTLVCTGAVGVYKLSTTTLTSTTGPQILINTQTNFTSDVMVSLTPPAPTVPWYN